MARRLIVGLGNPGAEYRSTRHNLGFEVVRAFAKRHGWKFERSIQLKGERATGMFEEDEIICLLPMSYMNRSGEAVKKAVGKYNIAFTDGSAFLVVVDDVYLKVGSMRLRAEGSTGGHNGLKSIQDSLSSTQYARLKMGVGPNDWEDVTSVGMEKFVLSPFGPKEKFAILQAIEKGADVLDCWQKNGLEKARQMAGENIKIDLDDQTSQEK